ncbi:hypothetical protein PHYPSEUDO_008475 [Phytophthora pseudosyringae]|uniref:Uncharacterized protein n=1 Tax=Phytophthora pseudosyringae TaxID=221518 RepID=A0A8T1VJC3_9STRA|nr:hypothetical protein PHYPSEUDO_008475 [Phytophthora pseudosyringae]
MERTLRTDIDELVSALGKSLGELIQNQDAQLSNETLCARANKLLAVGPTTRGQSVTAEGWGPRFKERFKIRLCDTKTMVILLDAPMEAEINTGVIFLQNQERRRATFEDHLAGKLHALEAELHRVRLYSRAPRKELQAVEIQRKTDQQAQRAEPQKWKTPRKQLLADMKTTKKQLGIIKDQYVAMAAFGVPEGPSHEISSDEESPGPMGYISPPPRTQRKTAASDDSIAPVDPAPPRRHAAKPAPVKRKATANGRASKRMRMTDRNWATSGTGTPPKKMGVGKNATTPTKEKRAHAPRVTRSTCPSGSASSGMKYCNIRVHHVPREHQRGLLHIPHARSPPRPHVECLKYRWHRRYRNHCRHDRRRGHYFHQ